MATGASRFYSLREDDVEQGSKEWRRLRYEAAGSTGSVLTTALGKLPYPSRDYPCPAGVSQAAFNRELHIRRAAGEIPEEVSRNTGDLDADRMRCGTSLEPAIRVMLHKVLGVPITPLPSIVTPEYGMRISPDGFVWGHDVPCELKAPRQVKRLRCARHPRGNAECPKCISFVVGIYEDQVQAEMYAVGNAPSCFFTQLETMPFIEEVLHIPGGRDAGMDVCARVADFCRDCVQDVPGIFPRGKGPGDYIYTIVVPRDATWAERVGPQIEACAREIRARREKIGMTFERYCEMNNL